jgi:hypothetical protein
MTDRESSGRSWRYRFTTSDGAEIETKELNGDGPAEAWGRELSQSQAIPVVIHRHSAHVDAWEYVTEVDERH